MIQIIPEIYVHNCSEALVFYQKLFGGTIKNLQMAEDVKHFQDMPGKVIHSELHVSSNCVFYFLDILDHKKASSGNITLMLHLENQDEASRIFRGLARGGNVLMELQKTFGGTWHAIVTDRFGAPWSLNYAE